jgi:threonine/homoserine/homoserine lactone efflux protein
VISGLFLGSSLVLITTPGPDSLLVSQLVLRTRQWRTAAAAALGMIRAGVLHAVLAMTGVALLLRTQPVLFTALQWLGVAVMLVWGAKAVRAAVRPAPPSCPGRSEAEVARRSAHAGRRYFTLGFLCTGSNPKVGLFLLAYLPQFVPAGTSQTRGMAVLAAVHLGMASLWLTTLIVVVHLARTRLTARRLLPVPGHPASPRTAAVARLLEAAAGAVFIGFAVRLVWP